MKSFVLLFVAFVAAATAKVSYDGYEVYRVDVSPENVEVVHEVAERFNLDIWASSRTFVDFSVEPRLVRAVKTSLGRHRIPFRQMIADVGFLIAEEEKRLNPHEFTLDNYNTFEDIEAYLAQVDASSEYATLRSLGQSIEGRDLWQMKISVGTGKPAVWIDCNIHAREWITGATCLYGIDYLTGSYGTDPDVTSLLDAYDVYIMPINNPDGYSFTWSDDRMWRKNRRKYDEDLCYGVDINRNFDDNFGGDGTSSSSCSEVYHGPSPASEPETVATQNGIKDLVATADLQILFSIHSYSELWMYPYGYTFDLPPNADDLDRISQVGVEALAAVNGIQYTYGPVASTIYPAASTTIDYSYSQGVANSFTLELRDTGTYGFILPAEQITPTAEETWAGLIASILAA